MKDIQEIVNKIDYFKKFSKDTKTECGSFSKIKVFQPDQIVLGTSNFVFFIVKGSCCIIEHLTVRVHKFHGSKSYDIFDPSSEVSQLVEDEVREKCGEEESDKDDYKRGNKLARIMEKCMSLSCSNKYHIESRFIQVCELNEGACFNIGENLASRQVVAKTKTTCLLVPRFFILKTNEDHMWTRVQNFLNTHIPTTEEVFRHFLEENELKRYKKSLVAGALAQKVAATNNSIQHVPLSIRIRKKTT